MYNPSTFGTSPTENPKSKSVVVMLKIRIGSHFSRNQKNARSKYEVRNPNIRNRAAHFRLLVRGFERPNPICRWNLDQGRQGSSGRCGAYPTTHGWLRSGAQLRLLRHGYLVPARPPQYSSLPQPDLASR